MYFCLTSFLGMTFKSVLAPVLSLALFSTVISALAFRAFGFGLLFSTPTTSFKECRDYQLRGFGVVETMPDTENVFFGIF